MADEYQENARPFVAAEGAERRFEQWRRTRKGRSRIPEPLWALAVKMAGTHGLHRTAKTLRVSCYSLKKRVEREAAAASGMSGKVPAATFIELAPPLGAASCECTLELEAPGGAKMRVHLTGGESPDLAALSQSFYRGEA